MPIAIIVSSRARSINTWSVELSPPVLTNLEFPVQVDPDPQLIFPLPIEIPQSSIAPLLHDQ